MSTNIPSRYGAAAEERQAKEKHVKLPLTLKQLHTLSYITGPRSSLPLRTAPMVAARRAKHTRPRKSMIVERRTSTTSHSSNNNNNSNTPPTAHLDRAVLTTGDEPLTRTTERHGTHLKSTIKRVLRRCKLGSSKKSEPQNKKKKTYDIRSPILGELQLIGEAAYNMTAPSR